MIVEFSLSELTVLDRAIRQRRKTILKSMEDMNPDSREFNYRIEGLKNLDKLHSKLEDYKRKAKLEESEEYAERIGEESYSADGKRIKIIKYKGSKNITVQFEDGQILQRQSYNKFKNHKIMSREAFETLKRK